MKIEGKTVLVTGANRGIGQALVTEALSRGAARVYAGTRQPLAHPDARVTPLNLDVTDAAQIQAAAESVESLDILVNNAGIALYDDLSERAALEQHLAVNLFGTYGVIQAFLPLLTGSQGAIVNNVSTMALAPFPFTPAYAISKAAAFNLTQSLRALLAGRGVRVHAVLTGPTDTDMTIEGKAVLVTGANRGIGQALVTEALARGASRVYAGTRQPLAHPDPRVTPLTLDVTDAGQIQDAAASVESLDILINNAGIALYDDLGDRAALEQHLAVNLYGTYGVTQAFLPLLASSQGAIVNNVSTMAVAPFPFTPAYAISKAAAFNLTQSLRALLTARGVRVHAVLTGPTDTDMTRGFEVPKATPRAVAQAILDGVERGDEDIFPDPTSETVAESWRTGAAKALERESAAVLQAA